MEEAILSALTACAPVSDQKPTWRKSINHYPPPPHLYPTLLVLRTGFKLLLMVMQQKVPWAGGLGNPGSCLGVGGRLFPRALRGVHPTPPPPNVAAALPLHHTFWNQAFPSVCHIFPTSVHPCNTVQTLPLASMPIKEPILVRMRIDQLGDMAHWVNFLVLHPGI